MRPASDRRAAAPGSSTRRPHPGPGRAAVPPEAGATPGLAPAGAAPSAGAARPAGRPGACGTEVCRTLFATFFGLACAAPAAAQVIVLDPIVVSRAEADGAESADVTASTAAEGNAAAQAALRAPEPVSVVTRAEVEREGVADALETVPGVLSPTSADDPATSVNIRGLQDHGRVIVRIDGARQNFSRSGHASEGSFYVDGEMVKQITVTRGPSTVIGGSAVGGTVELTTIDADDVLDDDETIGARFKSGITTNGPGGIVHGEVATRIGQAFDIVVAGTVDQQGDYNDGDGERVLSASNLRSGLLKARLRVAEGHETTLSALRVYNEFDSGVSTLRDTRSTADTVTLSHTYAGENPLVDLTGRVYYSGTHLDQKDILDAGFGERRSFDVKTYGGEPTTSPRSRRTGSRTPPPSAATSFRTA